MVPASRTAPGSGRPDVGARPGQEAKQIFSAPAGLHAHFPMWSPDETFIYFVQGSVPDRMDIWRIPPSGRNTARITHHDSRVSHPVFLDARTLLYLATDGDGSGPWLYSIDLDRRQPRRVSFGLERYTSLAASADGRRLVATAREREEHALALPSRRHPRGACRRHAHLADHRQRLLAAARRRLSAVSSRRRVRATVSGSCRRAPPPNCGARRATRIIGAPSIARDGRRISFRRREAATRRCTS